MNDALEAVAGEQAVEQPKRRGRPKQKTEEEKLLPVKLMRNYRPRGNFKVMVLSDPEDPASELVPRDPEGSDEKRDGKEVTAHATGEYAKVRSGATILLTTAEAQDVVRSPIAIRADEFA